MKVMVEMGTHIEEIMRLIKMDGNQKQSMHFTIPLVLGPTEH
jgi:hypothetical protein